MRTYILVVEDEVAINEIIATALQDEGFTVLTAADGVAALECLRQHTPDVIVLDYMLPHMDGAAFVTEARRRDLLRGTPILLLTAGQPARWARAIGAAAALQKPCDLDTLIAGVARLAARPHYQQHPTAISSRNEQAS